MGKKKKKQQPPRQQQQQRQQRQQRRRGDGDAEFMPLAAALRDLDAAALRAALEAAAGEEEKEAWRAGTAAQGRADDAPAWTLRKTVGEAFTGGRSTPVYEVRSGGDGAAYLLICKLVEIPDPASAKGKAIVLSYEMEARFYAVLAPALKAAVSSTPRIPRSLCTEVDKASARFVFVMNDLRAEFPLHPEFLSVDQAALAMQWVGRFHGCLYTSPGRADLVAASGRGALEGPGGWTCGTFWNPGKCELRAGCGATESSSWQQCTQFLAKRHAEVLGRPGIKALGARVSKAREALGALVHPTDPWVKKQSAAAQRVSRAVQDLATIVHGDLKAANLFLCDRACAGVDFQFSGLGLGCVDLAYFFFPDARGDYFEAMPGLLAAYWDALVETCPRFAGVSVRKLEFLVDMAQVDLFRYYLERGWVPASAQDVSLIERVDATLGALDGHEVGEASEFYAEAVLRSLASL